MFCGFPEWIPARATNNFKELRHPVNQSCLQLGGMKMFPRNGNADG
jgi:hypothetical protein